MTNNPQTPDLTITPRVDNAEISTNANLKEICLSPCFNSELFQPQTASLLMRNFKLNRTDALAEWRQLQSA